MTATATTWAVRVDAALVGLTGVAAFALGLFWVAQDMGTSGEMFDGLGIAIGLVCFAVGLVPVAVAAVSLRLVRRRPFAAAVLLCTFGALASVAGAFGVGPFGMLVSAPLVLGGLVVAAIGFGAALGARDVAIDSPGGFAR